MDLKSFRYPLFHLGIIGGGQLGKMMTQEAKKMGFWVIVLDPEPSAPAAQMADETITASFFDRQGLEMLVRKSDVVTYDIEHVDAAFLQEVKGREKIHPAPSLLMIIQNKLRQKEVLRERDIPLPRFAPLEDSTTWSSFGFPLVRKTCYGGYDGRGVSILRDMSELSEMPSESSFFEEYVPIGKELAVLVARGKAGEIALYPVVEMIFEPEANICSMVLAPAQIAEEKANEAQKIARECVEVLQGVGIFAVEMFLSKDGRLFVNEIAPRPHNSGHFTIEACVTSQFEQHLRAICGLPLGSTDLLTPAVMINLLGAEGYQGSPCIEGLREVLAIPGASFHFYGKRETRPFRKMGHVTVLARTLDEALSRALQIKELLKIKA